jgi:hypothetical protein
MEETIKAQQELIDLLYGQVVDLTMMSKIELGDDVIQEIIRLKNKINKIKMEEIYIEFGEVGAPSMYEITKLIYNGGQ